MASKPVHCFSYTQAHIWAGFLFLFHFWTFEKRFHTQIRWRNIWTDFLSLSKKQLHFTLACCPSFGGYTLQKQLKTRKKFGPIINLRAENKLGKLKHYNSKPFRVGAKQRRASGLSYLVLLPLGLIQLPVNLVSQIVRTKQLETPSKQFSCVLVTCCWYLCVTLQPCACFLPLQWWGRLERGRFGCRSPLLLGTLRVP